MRKHKTFLDEGEGRVNQMKPSMRLPSWNELMYICVCVCYIWNEMRNIIKIKIVDKCAINVNQTVARTTTTTTATTWRQGRLVLKIGGEIRSHQRHCSQQQPLVFVCIGQLSVPSNIYIKTFWIYTFFTSTMVRGQSGDSLSPTNNIIDRREQW